MSKLQYLDDIETYLKCNNSFLTILSCIGPVVEEEKSRNNEGIFPVVILFTALISCHTCVCCVYVCVCEYLHVYV